MKVQPIFAWYDAWIGFYWDRQKRRLYVLPLPFVGVVFDFSGAREWPARSFVVAALVLWLAGCTVAVLGGL